jgi:hypothetical protein
MWRQTGAPKLKEKTKLAGALRPESADVEALWLVL